MGERVAAVRAAPEGPERVPERDRLPHGQDEPEAEPLLQRGRLAAEPDPELGRVDDVRARKVALEVEVAVAREPETRGRPSGRAAGGRAAPGRARRAGRDPPGRTGSSRSRAPRRRSRRGAAPTAAGPTGWRCGRGGGRRAGGSQRLPPAQRRHDLGRNRPDGERDDDENGRGERRDEPRAERQQRDERHRRRRRRAAAAGTRAGARHRDRPGPGTRT